MVTRWLVCHFSDPCFARGRRETSRRWQNPLGMLCRRISLACLDKSRFWIRFQSDPKIHVIRTPVLTNWCAWDQMSLGAADDYPSDLVDGFAVRAPYVEKIPGTRPAIPSIEQVSKFTFMISLKTAKALGRPFPGIAVARRRNNRIERDFRCWHEMDQSARSDDVRSSGRADSQRMAVRFRV